MSISVTIVPSEYPVEVLRAHWACHKIDCDCDMVTDELMDNEQRAAEEVQDGCW